MLRIIKVFMAILISLFTVFMTIPITAIVMPEVEGSGDTETGTITINKIVYNINYDKIVDTSEFNFFITDDMNSENSDRFYRTVTVSSQNPVDVQVPLGKSYFVGEQDKDGYINYTGITIAFVGDKVLTTQVDFENIIYPISISKTVDKREATAGQTVNYTISIENQSGMGLEGIVVSDSNLKYEKNVSILKDGTFSVELPYVIPEGSTVDQVINNTATAWLDYLENIKVPDIGGLIESEEFPFSFEATCTVKVVAPTQQTEVSPSVPVSTPITPVATPAPIVYSLLTAKTGEGTIAPLAGNTGFNAGTVVVLNATPADGWKFDGWTGDNVVDGRITMDGNKSITAVFSKIEAATQATTAIEVAPEPVAEGEAVESAKDDSSAEIKETPVPLTLPKTSGFPAIILSGMGGTLAGLGILLRRRRK